VVSKQTNDAERFNLKFIKMAGEKEDLNQFLQKVDDLESIIKGMNAEDEETRKESMARADKIVDKHKNEINHTSINQKAFDELKPGQPALPPPNNSSSPAQSAVNPDAFMSAIEVDVQERKARRIKNSAEALRIKDLGNEKFKVDDYEGAVTLYSEALSVYKNNTVLWTNRAQACNKLEQYEKALVDCDWALRVSETCLKAYIHQGKAYLGLKKYDEARTSFEEAAKIEPKKKSAIQNYIDEVERLKQADEAEVIAQGAFDAGGKELQGVVEVLQKIDEPNKIPMYYEGGLRLLTQILTGNNERTLFRTNNGISLIKEHPVLSVCFRESPSNLSKEQIAMCASLLETLKAACTENDENCFQLLNVDDLPAQLLVILETKGSSCDNLRQAVLSLLFKISLEAEGRKSIINKIDVVRLSIILFSILEVRALSAYTAVAIFNNLALEKKFRIELRSSIEKDILPSFEKLLSSGNDFDGILTTCITAFTNMCTDSHTRRTFAERIQLREAIANALSTFEVYLDQERTVKLVEILLSLMKNIMFEYKPSNMEHFERICSSCVKLSSCKKDTVEQLAMELIGQIIPHSTDLVKHVCESSFAAELISKLKSPKDDHHKAALKCLTLCTADNQAPRVEVLKTKGLSPLVNLLKHEDEIIFGNAALCLSHITEEKGVAGKLTKTNVIQHLLILARDARNNKVQHNCAILIAKLTKNDKRHLDRLRELHGVEILVDVMRNVKE